ncbi:AcrR family transcriptional regulator [Caulobacter ginsengisoli]|uniref:AcrR family transcriptional regulator n=1 Tax=Caulobacter ginsengisoli TaxID=400775 RepID=A0ABU0IXI0_9CAUL|nr:TetR family transcriptional regulator [Caulobacter ginsengisoli]MDQ0466721.1 AcrR family transcriptional regulator [Caulobacter ginsengisoli]
MKPARRTQAERSEATRLALVDAGRELFAGRGYGHVGADEIARAAGVTRGALYHHFKDKTELFQAVYEAVETEVIEAIAEGIAAAPDADPIARMRLGTRLWLEACGDPAVRQVALVDAPAVLGVTRWREISTRYGLGLTEGMLTQALESGLIASQPIRPLAHVLLGALREASLYLAGADDTEHAREEVTGVMDRLILSLRTA